MNTKIVIKQQSQKQAEDICAWLAENYHSSEWIVFADTKHQTWKFEFRTEKQATMFALRWG